MKIKLYINILKIQASESFEKTLKILMSIQETISICNEYQYIIPCLITVDFFFLLRYNLKTHLRYDCTVLEFKPNLAVKFQISGLTKSQVRGALTDIGGGILVYYYVKTIKICTCNCKYKFKATLT